MIVPSQLALKIHTNLGCAASFATLDKLIDKFTLPPAALPIGDASLTHVIKLAAHSTTSPTPTAMRQSYIITPYFVLLKIMITPKNYTINVHMRMKEGLKCCSDCSCKKCQNNVSCLYEDEDNAEESI
jgi:hypothetical protein